MWYLWFSNLARNDGKSVLYKTYAPKNSFYSCYDIHFLLSGKESTADQITRFASFTIKDSEAF